MVRFIYIYPLLVSLFLFPSLSTAQERAKTEVQLAHEDKGALASFHPSKKNLFKARVFRVNPNSETTEQHHWFLQILDQHNYPVNNAEIILDAYRKGKKNVKLKYMGPVFPLCAEGKYIIGFIEPQQLGMWKLAFQINHYGKTDDFLLEKEIKKEE